MSSIRPFFAGALIGLSLLSILITGYGIYLENHAMQIPLVQILNQPGLYPGDPFAASLVRYGAPLWRALAFVSRFVNLPILLTLLFIVTRVAAIAAAGLLARSLRPQSLLAMLAAMMLIACDPRPIIGAGTVLETIFEHTSLAVACFVLAFAAWQAARYRLWMIAWVAGCFCNPLYGLFASAYLLAFLAVDRGRRQAWRRWAGPVAIALVLVVPMLAWSYLSMKPTPYDREAWLLVNRLRAEHHMNPFAWSRWSWLRFAGLAAATGWLAWLTRAQRPRLSRFLAANLATCMIWLWVCLVAYMLQVPFVLLLHAARGTDFFYVFGVVGIACLLAPADEDGPPQASGPLPMMALMALPFCFHPEFARMLCALAPLLAVAAMRQRKLGRRWMVSLLLLPPLLIAAGALVERDGVVYIRPDRHLSEIAEWSRSHTSRGARFLIDPEWTEFRALAQRPVFVTWKDAGAIPWQRDYAREWLDRLAALGADLTWDDSKDEAQDRLDAAWEDLDSTRVQALAQRYGIDYWITDETEQTPYPQVFESGNWRVFKIDTGD